MKAIVWHDANRYRYLKKYTSAIYHISEKYKIVDIRKQYLSSLSSKMKCVEPNFLLELYEIEELEKDVLKSDMLLITIGAYMKDARIDAEYNMGTHTLKRFNKDKHTSTYKWIHCYDFDDKTDAVKYIQCIRFLYHFAKCYSKPIIIYSHTYVNDEKFRYRSLTYKIINEYLEKLKGVFVVKTPYASQFKSYISSSKNAGFYIDKAIYLDEPLSDAIKKVMPLLGIFNYKNIEETSKQLRQVAVLFEDNVFYRAIDPEEEIYILPDISSDINIEKYVSLGIKHVPLIGSYGMLYGKKKDFDTLRDELIYNVIYPYYVPILSHPKCDKINTYKDFSYNLYPDELKYRGKDVYIGVIAVDDVDYTHTTLRTPHGKSRIACIWRQTRADEGTFYYKEDIDNELASQNPGSQIPLPEGESMSTMMLALAGGSTTQPSYQTIATESEFLVAKINPASEGMQRIYAGIPCKYAVSIGDVLVGVIKLISIAVEAKKPLVLCLPFNSNIDPHDGTVPLYAILQILANRAGVAIIAPAGDEADKMHHSNIRPSSNGIATVDINVPRANQNVIGMIYQDFANLIDVLLYPPKNISTRPVSLKRADVINIEGTIIYDDGYRISPLNGSVRLFFRIDNPHVGNWRIEFNIDTTRVSKTHLWISQKEVNEFITLTPSDAFITIGSTACINTLIVVGGFDQNYMIPLGSSGRGYTRNNIVKPDFITNVSNVIAPCSANEWASVTGTIPATCIMAGVVATLFNRFQEENIFPLPNSLVMNSILLTQISQIGDIEYPNPRFGYGVFELSSLNRLLEEQWNIINNLA